VVRVFNDRGSYRCKAEVSRTRPARRGQRPGHLVAQVGLDGTNVNELTSQALTDIGARADVLRLPGEVERVDAA
jgi:anaerobic selenocysteine-containing dehydrogenase